MFFIYWQLKYCKYGAEYLLTVHGVILGIHSVAFTHVKIPLTRAFCQLYANQAVKLLDRISPVYLKCRKQNARQVNNSKKIVNNTPGIDFLVYMLTYLNILLIDFVMTLLFCDETGRVLHRHKTNDVKPTDAYSNL